MPACGTNIPKNPRWESEERVHGRVIGLALTTVLPLTSHNCFNRPLEPLLQLPKLDHPMNPAGIDTSALLTMLGLITTVWAVVPSTARLSFRLSLNWFDWMIIWAALLTIHGLFFQPTSPHSDFLPLALGCGALTKRNPVRSVHATRCIRLLAFAQDEADAVEPRTLR